MTIPNINSIQHLLIIGNGFDLDLDLKTSYADFLDTNEFQALANPKKKPNALAKYLAQVRRESRWVDIEQELAGYSERFGRQANAGHHSMFKASYEEIIATFAAHVRKENVTQLNVHARSYQLMDKLASSGGLCVIDFNYTNTAKRILDQTKKPCSYIQVHGNAANDGKIVFGVQDNARIHDDHEFLHKSTSRHLFADFLVGEAMKKTQETISIFGHSLGASDHTQFKPFFSSANSNRTKLDIHYHDENSYGDLYRQIKILTGKEILKFRTKHKFEMVGPSS